MGNYVFTADALVEALEKDAADESSRHDMGGDIVPYFVGRNEAAVYDFKRNDVPGSTALRPRLLARRRDGRVVPRGAPRPGRRSSRPSTSTTTTGRSTPTTRRCLARSSSRRRSADDAIVSSGSIVSGATIRQSVLGHNVYVSTGALVDRSVVMDNVKIGPGARLVNAIIDKNVVIPDGVEIGVDAEADRAAGFTVTDEGITVLGKGQPVPGDYSGPA